MVTKIPSPLKFWAIAILNGLLLIVNITAVISFLGIWRPSIELKLAPVVKNEGYAYWSALPKPWASRLTPDDRGESTGVVFEDGKPLPLGHALHQDIRELGRGRFSHWGTGVLFSSSDSFDPLTNKRLYTLRYYFKIPFYIFFISVAIQIILICSFYFHTIKKIVLKIDKKKTGLFFWILFMVADVLFFVSFFDIWNPHVNFEMINVSKSTGYLYIYEINKSWRRFLASDIGGVSTGVIYENGQPLLIAHALHQDIREKGEGRYSHWGSAVYFSTSDNSNPMTNGKKYSFSYKFIISQFDFFIPLFLIQIYMLYSIIFKKATTIKTNLINQIPLSEDKKQRSWATLLCCLSLIFFSYIILSPLVDQYYFYSFEADSQTTINYTKAFMDFFGIGDFKLLPALNAYPPYFDGQYIIYSIGGFIVKILLKIGLINQALLPTDQSVIIYTMGHVNLLAQIAAGALFFLAVRLVCRSNTISLVVSAIFLLSPQILNIGLLRVDWVVIFFLIAVLFFSLKIINQRPNININILVGITLAGLLSTKITSVVFVVIPATALIIATTLKHYNSRSFKVLYGSFLFSFAAFSFRYLYHAGAILSNFQAKINDVKGWNSLLSVKPYLYYSWDYFLPHGYLFLSILIASMIFTIYVVLKKHEVQGSFLLFLFVFFTILGIPAFKYSRGGYHLIPIYLLLIAYAAGFPNWIFKKVLPFKYVLITIILAVMVLIAPGLKLWTFYQKCKTDAVNRDASERITRIDARGWFIQNIPPKSRIAIMRDSDYASPPIFDLGYDFSPDFLYFPYHDKKRCESFYPPDFRLVDKSCDLIMLNDFHKVYFLEALRGFGYVQLASQWDEFFQQLSKRYELVEFKSPYVNYGISKIEVYFVNTTCKISANGDR